MCDTMQGTSQYRIVEDTIHGRRYRFYCDLLGICVYTTPLIQAETQEEELILAWEFARPYFNGCESCGRWICDAAYNTSQMQCVACAPGCATDTNKAIRLRKQNRSKK